MPHEKVDWITLAIGWCVGAFVALSVTTIFQIPPIVVLVVMVLLPMLISWVNDIARH